MAKSKRSSGHIKRLSASDLEPRQLGLRSFQAGRFDAAIQVWAPLAAQDAPVRAALAEAHFRRALGTPVGAERVVHLREALVNAPNDPRYEYQLGMALHRAGDLTAAAAHYRAVFERTNWPGAALLLAVATLEQNAHTDLATVPGSTPAIRAALSPAQALLNGQTPVLGAETNVIDHIQAALAIGRAEAEGVEQLWQGLAQIDAGNGRAAHALGDNWRLPTARLAAIRQAYGGVAAAQVGDLADALGLWRKARESAASIAVLDQNLAAALFGQITTQIEAGNLAEAAASAQESLALPFTDPALNQLRVRVLDQAAHAAAVENNWPQATILWEGMRQIVGASSGLGSPRPLLRNLALGYEAQERWIEAADSWRAMLRTRPRRNAADSGELSEEQWTWVRKRVIECYKHAGRPDEAVAVFRQLIKAEPDDLDLRVQLADALLANEQEQAAFNEIQRVLDRNPQFVDAIIRQSAFLSARRMWPAAEQVLRDAMKQHSDRTDLRRQLARLLLEHGNEYLEMGNSAAAIKALAEGQELEPENYQFPITLAQTYFHDRKPKLARPLLERALELAGDQAEPYVEVIRSWVIEDNIEQARAVLVRAEAAIKTGIDLYLPVGLGIITQTTPRPAIAFNLFGPIKPLPQTVPADTPWSRFAIELLDKAVASQPNDGRVHAAIASGLLQLRPDLALTYAERAAALMPDAAECFLLLGLVLAMNERKREAKQRLQHASQIARRQGNGALAQQAESMRREIDNPLFRTMMQMQGLFDQLGDEEIDFS